MIASGLWQSAAGLFDACLRQARHAFGDDAVDAGEGKRRAPSGVTRSEDDELPVQKRRKLLSQTRDLARKFALLGWAIRQHLNYITTFNFQPKTGSRRLNQQLAAFLETWSEPENFDVAGIMPLWNFIRLAEVRRCIDGDLLTLKLANGQVQAIEGDRLLSPVATAPRAIANRNWFHGVELDRYGRHLAYAVHRRGTSNDFGAVGSSRFEFERAVPAHQAMLFAHRERFDQVRGITPLTAAINSLVVVQGSWISRDRRAKLPLSAVAVNCCRFVFRVYCFHHGSPGGGADSQSISLRERRWHIDNQECGMAARHYWELEGIFVFGEPLKIFAIEIERESGDPLPYSVIDFAIEDNVHLWTRLMDKFNSKGSGEFERLYLLPTVWNGLDDVVSGKADQLTKPRLYSLLKHTPSYHGPILGIAVDKSPGNMHIVNRFRHSSPLVGAYRG